MGFLPGLHRCFHADFKGFTVRMNDVEQVGFISIGSHAALLAADNGHECVLSAVQADLGVAVAEIDRSDADIGLELGESVHES